MHTPLRKNIIPHTEQINACELQPVLPPPPIKKTNYSALVFLGANRQQRSRDHSPNATDTRSRRSPRALFLHVSSRVSVLPTDRSLACPAAGGKQYWYFLKRLCLYLNLWATCFTFWLILPWYQFIACDLHRLGWHTAVADVAEKRTLPVANRLVALKTRFRIS